MTTTRTWDQGERLASINNTVGTPSTASVTSHSYLYDALQRRTQATLEDGSRWKYDYNDRNELTAGKRHWADWSPVSGQRFEYAFDNIGNRTSSKAGGDVNGANLRTTTYAANQLNQITQRSVPGAVDVMGAATATATNVNVNNVLAYRKGEYYRVELSVNNASVPQWQSVTNRCVQSGVTNSVTGNLFLPLTPEDFTHDNDGNLFTDGAWYYNWDAENRLKNINSLTTVPTAAKRYVDYVYDHLGRRVSKVVMTNYGGGYAGFSTNRYVYDGWNLIAELDNQNNPVRSYAWGQDLSGTLQKAGGVGGLLMVRDHAASATHFAGFDGNGNVTVLVKTDGTLSARYEYSPFGELLRATGPLAKSNPFRWSTKFWDEESGFVYYGFRYYNPTLGRWIGRDPLGEKGGINYYAFLRNQPITKIDSLGDREWNFDEVRQLEEGVAANVEYATMLGAVGNLASGYSYMYENFKGGGTFDFKDRRPDDTFNIGSAVLKADEFGNFLAGYAAGVAFMNGDATYAMGVFSVGQYYVAEDYLNVRRGIPGSTASWIGSVNMQYQGMIEGMADSIIGIND